MPRRASLANCLRMVFMAMLLLGLCLQPVLAAVGEAHEAAAHASRAASHVHVDIDVEAAGSDGDAAGADDSTLHDLMHFAHCCGQVSTVLPSGLQKLAAQPLQRTSGGDLDSLPLSKRPSQHDRPPISN